MEGFIGMYSLAILVAILFIIAILGGPIAFALTYIPGQSTVRKIIRRVPILILAFMSLVICSQLLIAAVPLMGKTVGVFGLTTDYFALRREFFSDIYLRKYLKGKGVGGGRSSGNDGHGPEGQH
jgi:hypothetical protein